MHQISETGFLRLKQILGDAKANPPIPAILPICRSSWWLGVKDGRFPASVKLGPRTTAWRVEDILALLPTFSAPRAAADPHPSDRDGVEVRQP